MTLNDILRVKGSAVHTIGPDASLDEVVERLVRQNCGSLVVCTGAGSGTIAGIITERDIMQAYAHYRGSLEGVRVRDVMTAELITGTPQDSVEDTMGLMTNRRVRHLPILDDEHRLAGLISIGDVVKAQHDSLSLENHYLKEYIHS